MTSNNRPIYLVFGASGHIGGPAASWILSRQPEALVRVVTSKPDGVAVLSAKFPDAEAIHADYFDLESLKRAFDGVRAVLIVTPDFLDEETAMKNVVEAAKTAPDLQRVIRITGDPPGIHDEKDVPEFLRKYNGGSAVQHTRARRILSESGLPVAYLNVCAWLMDNLATFMLKPIVERHTVVMPFDRVMNFIDTRDIGRVGSELLMDSSRTMIGHTYQLHNGVDSMIRFSRIAEIFSDALGVPFGYDDSAEAHRNDLGPGLSAYYSRTENATSYYYDYFKWEHDMTVQLMADGPDLLNGESDVHPRKFGFEPRALKEWIRDNREIFIRGG